MRVPTRPSATVAFRDSITVTTKFSKLARPSIRAMKAGDVLQEHGIKVERLRNEDIRYSVAIMVDGERVHRVIGKESEGCHAPPSRSRY